MKKEPKEHVTTSGDVNATIKPNSSNQEEMTQILEHKPIEGTPFTAVKHLSTWFLTLGKYRLTEALPSYEACVEESRDASWFRIMQIMKIMIEETPQKK